MKNIHILQTDKPSRLWVNNLIQGKLELSEETLIGSNTAQHIYITSDEEIKKDEYYLGDDNHIYNLVTSVNNNGKKIILTTDPALIADGVQAIDDEFLKWFVRNPSCEFVKTTKDKIRQDKEFNNVSHWNISEYKIIIPQEEPKQELDCPYDFTSRCTMGRCDCKPKQETLEEAAKNYATDISGELNKLVNDNFNYLIDTPENTILIPKMNADILYIGHDSKEILKISNNGDIFVKGRLVENDKEVVDALREFLTKQGLI